MFLWPSYGASAGLREDTMYLASTRPCLLQARTNLEKLNDTNVLKFNSSIEAFLTAAAPTCDNLVLECSLGTDRVMNGSTCCAEFFNPQPVFSRAGRTQNTSEWVQYAFPTLFWNRDLFLDTWRQDQAQRDCSWGGGGCHPHFDGRRQRHSQLLRQGIRQLWHHITVSQKPN